VTVTDRRVLLRPPLLAVHLLALVAVAVCLVGGFWQLDVYRSEQDTSRTERAAATAAPLTATLGPDAGITNELVGAPVVAEGRYAPADQQILVSGRPGGGGGGDSDGDGGSGRVDDDGYWVVSPLRLESGSAILVVRGWSPSAMAPPVPAAPVTVTGSLQPGEEPGADSVLGADRVVDSVRIPMLVGELPYDLYGAMLIRTAERPAPTDGLVPVDPSPPDVPWTDGLRNLAYALQWWVFAGFAVFMWWRICADQLGRGREPDTASGARLSDPAAESDDGAPLGESNAGHRG
jgi:surfeit locus 1 family protein